MSYPEKLTKLIESFEKLPTIGKKSAERLAIYVFSELSDQTVNDFSNSLKEVKSLKRCSKCHGLSDNDVCDICEDENRDKDIIMVVENIKDIFIFEKTKSYFGQYHVLNGAINFANNIGVDDLTINHLISKVKINDIKEVILATNASTSGDTTAQYIKKLLENYNCNVTKLAHGLPVGQDISYTDEVTLKRAMDARVII